MKKKLFSIYTTAVTIVLIIVLAILCVMLNNNKPVVEESEPKIETTTLEETLKQVSELTTTTYYYSDIGKYENSLDLNGWQLPFTKKDFILTYQGVANIGIDCSKLKVQETETNVTIICPNLELLYTSIDENSIELYDENTNIFNPISISDYTNFAKSQKQKIEKRVKTTDIWQEAKENTRTVLKKLSLLNPTTKDKQIKVVFMDEMEEK